MIDADLALTKKSPTDAVMDNHITEQLQSPAEDIKVLTAVYTYIDPSTVQHVFDSNEKMRSDKELGLPALGVSAVSLSDEIVRLELIEDVIESNPHNLDPYDRIEIIKDILSRANPSREMLDTLYMEYGDD
jgi:hypothetical protein